MIFSREQIRRKINDYVKAAEYHNATFLRDHGLELLNEEALDEMDFDSIYFLTLMNFNEPGGENLYEQE
jgi:hypothetical protein